MDKSKTLEVLRGMKFMQRKEEAKRRATFEVQQKEQVSRILDHHQAMKVDSENGMQRSATGPTFLLDNSFPIASYQLSRRSFATADVKDTAAENDHDDDLHQRKVEADALSKGSDGSDDDNDWADEDPTSLYGGAFHDATTGSTEQKITKEEKEMAETAGGERFTVDGAVRAPKLPRRLRETIENEKQAKRRRRLEEAEEYP